MPQDPGCTLGTWNPSGWLAPQLPSLWLSLRFSLFAERSRGAGGVWGVVQGCPPGARGLGAGS